MGRGEKVDERRRRGVNRKLPRNVIKSPGVQGEGAKVEDGGWRGMGEKSVLEELGIADQRGTKRFEPN